MASNTCARTRKRRRFWRVSDEFRWMARAGRVLELVLAGHTYRQIGRALGISISTVHADMAALRQISREEQEKRRERELALPRKEQNRLAAEWYLRERGLLPEDEG